MKSFAVLAGFALVVPCFAQIIPVPRDLSPLIASGAAKATGVTPDLGSFASVFDGKPGTLFRTPAINPATVTIAFVEPQTGKLFRLVLGDRCEFRIEAGETEATLRDLTGLRQTGKDGQAIFELAEPVTARVWRLYVKRLEGDDYVHIFDWQFADPSPVEQVKLEMIPARPEWPKSDTVSSGGVIKFRAVAAAKGAEIDVTREAEWSADGLSNFRGRPGEFIAPEVRTANEGTVTAAFGGRTVKQTVKIQPYEKANAAFDLNVLFIERTPRIDFDAPDRGNGPGWPADGQPVEWIAHVKSWGRDAQNVRYRWRLNDRIVETGTVDLRADTNAAVRFPWRWSQKRHTLQFELLPQTGEQTAENNSLSIETNALTIGFWVEQKLYDYFRDNQFKQADNAVGFEDWSNRQVAYWNRLWATARYEKLPNGLTDRVRIDRIIVVPSGALPLNGGLPSNNPDNSDKTVDLVWGFPVDPGHTISDYWTVRSHNPRTTFASSRPFFMDWGLIHELHHARYIIDSYGFDVHAPQVKVLLDDGTPLAGSPAMRGEGMVHGNKYRGIMGGGLNRKDEYVAMAMERVAGKRARGGNYNGPTVIGEYLQELPERNHFTFMGPDGKPLAGAELWIYQAGPGEGWYAKDFDNTPDLRFTLDAEGKVTLPRNPFSTGPIRHTYGHANSVALFRLKHAGRDYWHFQEATDFNIAYWKGQRNNASYIVKLDHKLK